MKKLTLHTPLPAGISGQVDPDEPTAVILTYQDVPVGYIQRVATGWVAVGLEDEDGTAPAFGVWNDPYYAALACKQARVA